MASGVVLQTVAAVQSLQLQQAHDLDHGCAERFEQLGRRFSVPPVAIRSSISTTRMPGRMSLRCTSIDAVPYSSS